MATGSRVTEDPTLREPATVRLGREPRGTCGRRSCPNLLELSKAAMAYLGTSNRHCAVTGLPMPVLRY